MATGLIKRTAFILGILLATGWQTAQAEDAASKTEGGNDGGTRPPASLPFNFGGSFELLDHDGKTVTDRDYAGKFMLVYFGYTYCPDICPTDLFKMGEALNAIGDLTDKVQPLFVTVDPERDTPEVLREYVANFHPSITGLSGSEKQIRAAAKAYRIHRVKVLQPDDEPDEYLVNHSTLTYLMGPDGEFVSLIPYGTESDRLAALLKKYLAAASS